VSALLLWFYCFTVMSIHPLVGGTTLIFFKIGRQTTVQEFSENLAQMFV
jgi:hypothetical protein